MKKIISILLLFTAALLSGQTSITKPAWERNGNAATSNNFLGTTNAVDLIFKTNNSERARFLSAGGFSLTGAVTTPTLYGSSASGGTLTIAGTSHATSGVIKVGTTATSSVIIPGNSIWLHASPTNNNYGILGTTVHTYLNCAPGGNVYVTNGGTSLGSFGLGGITMTPINAGGSTSYIPFNVVPGNSGASYRNAGTENNIFKFTGPVTTWAGNTIIPTQKFFSVTSNTLAFQTAGGVATDVYNAYIEAPTAGTNASITNPWALGLNGDVKIEGGNRRIIGSNAVTFQAGTGSNVVLNAGASGGAISNQIGGTQVSNINSGGVAITGSLSVSGTSTLTGNVVANGAITSYGQVSGSVLSVNSGDGDISSTNYGLKFRGYEPVSGTLQEKFSFQSSRAKTGANYSFSFTPTSFTAQTASAETPVFAIGTATVGHATGAIATQRDFLQTSITHSAIAASVITDAIGAQFNAPTAGANVTITNPIAIHSNGNFKVTGTMNVSGAATFAGNVVGVTMFANTGQFDNIYPQSNTDISIGTRPGSTTNNLIFKTNGSTPSESARFTTSGNLFVGTTTDVSTSLLTLNSTTKGFLPPRMTSTQASAISSPAEGLMIYVTDTNGTFTAKGWWGYDGAAWQKLNN